MTIVLPNMNAGLCSAKPRREHPRYAAYGSVPTLRRFEDVMPALIPRSEWSDRIKELEAKQMRISDLIDFPPKDQDGTNYCWANGPCQAANTAQRIANSPFDEFSAASVGAPITNYSNEGGWGIDAVKFLAEDGACSVSLWPNCGISRKYNTPAAEADRKNHQALEWIDIPVDNLDALATCLLQPWACVGGFNWWSHEVEICDLVEVSPGRFGIRIRNSWGEWGENNSQGVGGFAVLEGGKVMPDDAQAVRVVTAS